MQIQFASILWLNKRKLILKNSTKEGKIKVLVWLSNFFEDGKRYQEMTKENILTYLNSLRKPLEQGNGWINSYNNRQMIFLKFFRWLYNPEEILKFDVSIGQIENYGEKELLKSTTIILNMEWLRPF